MSPTRVAKLQKKVQYCHTCCRKLQGDCTGADQVERRGIGAKTDQVERQGIGAKTDQVERQGQVPLRRLFT